MAKALFKLANSKSVFLVEGEFVEGVEDGFVFTDFLGEKKFTIKKRIIFICFKRRDFIVSFCS
jgi:hypothetical protein